MMSSFFLEYVKSIETSFNGSRMWMQLEAGFRGTKDEGFSRSDGVLLLLMDNRAASQWIDSQILPILFGKFHK